jgi:hypothetical protein
VTLLCIFKTTPKLLLQSPARLDVVVIELALATRSSVSTTTLHGRDQGGKEMGNGSGRSRSPQPGANVEKGGWVGVAEI